jgi:hypothetical protein
MSRRFVIEAVMVAIYGELMMPSTPVEYLVPYTSVMELYEFHHSTEVLMSNPEDDLHVKNKISELIAYLEEPLNVKKLERALQTPWSKSPSIIFDQNVSWTVVNAIDTQQYGDYFDPIETETVLIAQRENAPVLTDQLELITRIIECGVPVQVFDISDFEFAMDDNITT